MKRRRTLVACSLIAAGIAAFGVFRASAVPFVNFLSINDVSVIEGDSGTTIAQFTVTLAPTALLETITVHYATANGSAIAEGDYATTSGDLTFLPGTSTQTFSVLVVGDVFAEPNEKFFVNLSNPTGASIADGTGEGTVTNDDGLPPGITINDVTPSEGAGTAVFTVSLSSASGQTVTVDYVTNPGTAVSPGDYTSVPGTVTFVANDTSESITVPIIDDALDENNETFSVLLSNPNNATISDDFGQGTILDNDPTPSLAIGDVTLVEGNSGTTNAVFGVTLSAASGRDVRVDYTTANGTAVQPSDYISGTGTLAFTNQATTQTVSVPVNGDTTFENNETFFVNLSGAFNATIADPQGQATITNDDAAPQIVIGDVTLTEGNSGTTNASFTVTKTGSSDVTSTVNFATANGTAIQPGDYIQTTGSLSFGPTDVNRTITVPVNGDTTFEADETFVMDLSGAVNATITDPQATATITNDDTVPTLAIGDVTLNEGNSGFTNFVFNVTRTGGTEVTATVDFATADGTAIQPGDYTLTSGTLTFAPSDVTRTVTVPVQGDALFEGTETFTVNLTNPISASITDPQGVGTIVEDDSAPTLAISDVVMTEGNAGTTNAVFTVTKTGTSVTTATVSFSTADESATAPGDYTTTSGQLTFPPATTTQTVSVPVVGDAVYENNETFVVNLTNVTNATISDPQGQATINNDDAAPIFDIGDVVLTEPNSGTTNAVFNVTKTGSTDITSTVNFSTADGTAIAPGDYATSTGTLQFSPSTTFGRVTITVFGDTNYENNETFFVDLSGATNATIGDPRGQATINNDDATPTLVISDVVLIEGNSGTSAAVFSVTKTGATDVTVTVKFTTADVTATAGLDYSPKSVTVTMAPQTTLVTETVTVYGDVTYERNEAFVVNLTNPQGAVLSDGQGQGMINNDDAPPTISIDDVAVAEGNSGTSLATFTLTKTGPSEVSSSVSYDTVGDTATEDVDFVGTSGTTVISPASSSSVLSITINGDVFAELDEFFFVNLTNPVDATLVDNQGRGTIQNDDGTAPSISVNDVAVNEGNSGTTNLVFTVALSVASLQTVNVTATTADGTATSPSDFAAVSRLVSFPPGTTTRPVTVTVTGDVAFESDETLFLNLTDPVNASISDSQGQGTIINDDALPSFSISDVSMTEGNSGSTNAIFVVTRTTSASITSTVNFATADSTATQPGDYTSNSGTLTFGYGVATQTVAVPIIGDTVFENNETFFVNLSGATNATISDSQGVGTIQNDETAPTLVIDDVSVVEGNAGTTNAVFTVTKSGITAVTATVNFTTANNTATQPSDYVSTMGSLTFAPNEVTKTVTVAVNGDVLFEVDETFFVNLTSPANATTADSQGLGTITNDDSGAPTLAINDVTLTEGNSGTTNAVFTVTKTGTTGVTATVNFATADNTAVQPGDYTLTSGVLTFAPSDVTKTVTVPVKGDTLFENNETFFVNLSSPTNATITDSQGLGTITNDDAGSPTLAIGDVTLTEGNSGTTNAVFTVTKTGTTGVTATVNFATADNTATQPSDYTTNSGTLTFAPATTTQTVTVPIIGDTVFETNETFFVNLSGATNATISDNQGLGTIQNDETAPTLAINDVTVVEGNAGTTNAVFTVTKSGTTAVTATVNFATANNTATQPSDYASNAGSLTFGPNEVTKTVTVPVQGDTLFEGNETYFVNLTNPAGATISDSQGQGTIQDDETAPALSINDVAVIEGNSGTTNAVLTVTKTGPTDVTATVNFATANNTATQPGDYTSTSGLLTFAPSEVTKTVTVPVNGDTLFENHETFFVNLSNPTNATISDSQGLGTITNDDTGAPTFTINDVIVTESSSGTTAVFTVTKTGATEVTATVNFATADGSATAPADYTAISGTLTFAPGVTTLTITVQIVGDSIVEGTEYFFVNLTNPVNGSIADAQGKGTINPLTRSDADPGTRPPEPGPTPSPPSR